MSHREVEDLDKQRILWEGPERFSDQCTDCHHSRAAHLSPGVMRPVNGGNCRHMIPVKTKAGKLQKPKNCECTQWKAN